MFLLPGTGIVILKKQKYIFNCNKAKLLALIFSCDEFKALNGETALR